MLVFWTMSSMQASFIFLVLLFCNPSLAQFPLLLHGHSHNDYTRERPLQEALENGFTSIEIDVFSWKGQIKVAHLKQKLKKKPTIKELYLEPLSKIITQNEGTVFQNDSTQLVLMIDLKKDKKVLYHLLKNQFKEYESIIEIHKDGQTKWGPIRIVLSGKPPMDSLLLDNPKYFTADLHPPNWSSNTSAKLAPRASSNYNKHFTYKGKGLIPESDQSLIKNLVKEAHDSGRKIRFWASDDNAEVWNFLLENGVDWINVDDLKKFRAYYLKKYK